jgi:hypothetical protein
VEFKSLPSGLHDVKSDLVYFVHGSDGQHAGVSAFAQDVADQSQRNASFCSVGALVPLAHGKLGKSWLHSPELRRLAQGLLKDRHDKRALELYWTQHRSGSPSASRPSTSEERRASLSSGLKRKRGASLSQADGPFAIDHPALRTNALLDTFGPLIFPLHRASLVRKRILILGTPPVQHNCDLVYLLSILSGIPSAALESLPADKDALQRPSALFSVGIADIGALADVKEGGFIATTTDDILGEKHQLYDLMVELPNTDQRKWPRLRTSDGRPVKATQRDLRRYRLLRAELRRLRAPQPEPRQDEDDPNEHDHAPLLQTHNASTPVRTDVLLNEREAVEPITWTAAAYTSLIWWASAGAEHLSAQAEDELQLENQLLADLPDIAREIPNSQAKDEDADAYVTATLLTSYFHRLTTHYLNTLAGIVEDAEDEGDDETEGVAIEVRVDEVREMGLDGWSESDKDFITAMTKVYFDREARVGKGEVWMCGMRVC